MASLMDEGRTPWIYSGECQATFATNCFSTFATALIPSQGSYGLLNHLFLRWLVRPEGSQGPLFSGGGALHEHKLSYSHFAVEI